MVSAELGQVVRTDQDSGSVVGTGHDDALMLVFHAIDDVAEVVADCPQGLRIHGHHCGHEWLQVVHQPRVAGGTVKPAETAFLADGDVVGFASPSDRDAHAGLGAGPRSPVPAKHRPAPHPERGPDALQFGDRPPGSVRQPPLCPTSRGSARGDHPSSIWATGRR